MRSLIAVSLIALACLLIGPPGSAPLASPLPLRVQPPAGLVAPVVDLRTKATIINHKRLCAWRENNGTAFGKSGFCHWGDDEPIGSPCTCEHTEEHNHIVHAGTVIEKPRAGGSSSSVH